MKLLVKNIENLVLPVKGNRTDGAYDIIATSEPKIVGVENSNVTGLPEGVHLYNSIDYIEYGTNLFVAPELFSRGELNEPLFPYLDARPRSSISKYNLTLANAVGLIDNGYRNEIKLRFKYVMQPEDVVFSSENGITNKIYTKVNNEKIYQKGDKIAQIQLFIPVPIEFELVDELPASDRGLGGFGSTGK